MGFIKFMFRNYGNTLIYQIIFVIILINLLLASINFKKLGNITNKNIEDIKQIKSILYKYKLHLKD